VNQGDTITLTWKAKNVNQITITDIGTITGAEALSGSRSVTVSQAKTYTASVPGDENNPHCRVPVTVNHVPPPVSSCISLTASKTSVNKGDTITLTWKAQNVSQITVTDVGTITGAEALSGSRTVTVNEAKTYYASVPGDENNPNCRAPVTVNHVPPPVSSCISLTASATEVEKGDSVILTWKAKNADQITVTDVGTITGAAANSGSHSVVVNADKTYTASVPGDEDNPNCRATVHIKSTHHGNDYRCISLTASDTSIHEGDTVTLTWSAEKGPVTIDHGVGTFTDKSGTVDVRPDDDITYHASIPEDKDNSDCTVSITLTSGGGGGHHHHHSSKPDVYFSSRQAPPLGTVYLSEIPYTGLDLGPVGTVVYWTLLVLWCLAAAYLALFGGIPFLRRKLSAFGASVSETLNQPALPEHAMAGAYAMPAASIPAARPAQSVHQAVHAAAVDAAVMEQPRTAPSPRLEMTGEGFKKFASAGSALTIDDIVKGLSRESGMQLASEPAPEEPAAPAYEAPAPAAAPAQEIPAAIERQAAPAPAPRQEQQAHAFSPDVVGFISSILEGERDAVFGTIRRLTQAGHDAEEFMAHAICALDDAYRARLDGTPVHEDVKRATDHLGTSFLERLVTALTTAVDGSYSMGVTGIKLALTRALAVAQG
jgi:hypothetical protein